MSCHLHPLPPLQTFEMAFSFLRFPIYLLSWLYSLRASKIPGIYSMGVQNQSSRFGFATGQLGLVHFIPLQ
jgi:hypothetical protein